MLKIIRNLALVLSVFLVYACSQEDVDVEPRPIEAVSEVPHKTENLIVVTLDGFRWQEVFKGIDPYLMEHNPEAINNYEAIIEKFGGSSENESRQKLLPFIWNVMAINGQVYGNRDYGNKVNVSNPYWLSYPGYNEIFTGQVNLSINSNKFGVSPDYNILEFFNQQEGFEGDKVLAVTNWEKFKDIFNQERNNLFLIAGARSKSSPVNLYVENEADPELVQEVDKLPFIHGNKTNFNYDKRVYKAAKDNLIKHRPKVLYISFSATDKNGHNKKYLSYLESAYNANVMLQDLWDFIQNDSTYKDHTTLFVTVDHGRGEKEDWYHHSSRVKHSDQTWFAVMGPDTKAMGEVKENGQWYNKQMTKTFAQFLGFEVEGVANMAGSIE